jgi:hypothetical protein
MIQLGHLRNPQCRRAPKGFQAQGHSRCPSPEQAGPSSLALASAQDGLEDGEVFDSEGADDSDSGSSSTASSDSDPVDNPPSAVPRCSARIAQQFGVRQVLGIRPLLA